MDVYIEVLKNKELVGYARENLLAHQKTFDQVKLRSEKGVGRRADLDQHIGEFRDVELQVSAELKQRGVDPESD